MINIKETKREFLITLFNKDIKKILDIGCGKGLMSKFFDKKGAKAIGIDLKRISEDTENFKFIEGDISKEDFRENNDLIIASLVLHFFDKEETLKIIERMKSATSKKGYNFLICMSDQEKHSNQEKFYPTLQEIKKIYKNWNLIKEVIGLTEIEEHDNLGSHQHNLIFVLFQKEK